MKSINSAVLKGSTTSNVNHFCEIGVLSSDVKSHFTGEIFVGDVSFGQALLENG